MSQVPHIPRATYRLQFGPRFTFQDATAIVPYLSRLGISHVYASPFFKARPGSTHGYDITNHNLLNPEVGPAEDFDRFSDALRAHGMGLIADFVPNHMGIGQADNEWWLDVLEWGQSSIYAEFFDINWMPGQRHLQGKVLLPLLGDHYGAVLERGEIEPRFDADTGTFSAWYHEHRLPIRPRHYAIIIRRQLARSAAAQALDAPTRSELERLAAEFDKLRRPGRRQRAAVRARALAVKWQLAECCRRNPTAAAFVAAATQALCGTPGDPQSFRALHGLLERQIYRLAFWRVAADEINYRRFFNISDLAGICMERQALFDLTHQLIGRLIADGRLQGIRIDHIDGLFDPSGYCRRLLEFARSRKPPVDTDNATSDFYIVVEKILARHERLPDDWPVAGTTGYEFTNLLNGLFVEPGGQRGLERAYGEFAGRAPAFDDTLTTAKDFVIDNILASELNVLATELDRISEHHWGTRDFTAERLRAALKEVVVQFPVYRTYVTGHGATVSDRRDIDWAVNRARRGWRGPDPEIFDFVQKVLTTDLAHRGGPYRRVDVVHFAMKFQQYTGPVTAKSLEDTAFYRDPTLLSLNEVGGDPRQYGVSPAAFHHANRQRQQRWPHSMLATATHDTKRGEDARARIDVLSEIPDLWRRRVRRWGRLNARLRREIDDLPAPSRRDEYAIYQTLVGAWPATRDLDAMPSEAEAQAFAERMTAYMIKAVREAKLVSSWDNPNQAYEDACAAFLGRLLDVARPNPFLADFIEFQTSVAYLGMLNSLTQLVLKLTSPGVPDIYQGTEVWDLSLVDPDNRRDVDFAVRQRWLDMLLPGADASSGNDSPLWRTLLADWPDGRIKLAIMHRLLAARRILAPLFADGGYEPLNVSGSRSQHIVAFQRYADGRHLVVATGRLFAQLCGWDNQRYEPTSVWSDTIIAVPRVSQDMWTDLITQHTLAGHSGESERVLQATAVFGLLPVAVLLATSDGAPSDAHSR